MCTALLHRPDGGSRLLLAMNRDERRTRAPELAPELMRTSQGVAWVGPRDSQAGGTWIGASERGVVACLLNLYEAEGSAPAGTRGRGEIIPLALDRGGLKDALAWLAEGFNPRVYAPFRLAVAGPEQARLFVWAGNGAWTSEPLETPWAMLSSSSWKTAEVLSWRRERFLEWQAAGAPCRDGLPELLTLQPEGLAAWGPLICRPDASTRSATVIDLDAERGTVELRYWPAPRPGDPGKLGASLALKLAREGVPSAPRKAAVA
jgi:hypothetical protein